MAGISECKSCAEAAVSRVRPNKELVVREKRLYGIGPIQWYPEDGP